MIELWVPMAAFFIAAASPGPATLAVAGVAMSSGARPALWLSIGLSCSLAAWGGLVALGLGPLVIASAPAQWALRVFGGVFLLYLAWGSLRAAMSHDAAEIAPVVPASPLKMITRGALLNGLNPKAGLAWAAVIALGGVPDEATGGAMIWIVVSICAVMGLAIYVAYAVLFASAGMRRAYARSRRWVDGAVALGFGAAGAALLLRRGDV